MVTREEFLEKLNLAHSFPCAYTFKLFGPNDEAFGIEVRSVLVKHLPAVQPSISNRPSSKANHQCITVVVDVPDAETVAAMYADFHSIDRLIMLL